VTQFLYHCAEATGTIRETVPMASGGGAESISGRHAPQQPATLFGKSHVRAEVAVQVRWSVSSSAGEVVSQSLRSKEG